MSNTIVLRMGFYSAILLCISSIAGCGASNGDAALYAGNEEATRKHMQQIQDQEQAHFKAENAAAAVAKNKNRSPEEQERANSYQNRR